MADDLQKDKPAKRHGKASFVGVGDAPPPSLERIVGRRERLLDSITRATGDRKAALEAEVASMDAQLADHRAAIDAILNPPPAGEGEPEVA